MTVHFPNLHFFPTLHIAAKSRRNGEEDYREDRGPAA